MSGLLSQVTYVAPVQYDATPEDRQLLQSTVEAFIQEHVDRHAGVVAIKVGFLLGMFLIFTETPEQAYLFPWTFNGWERFHDSTVMPSEKVFNGETMFYLDERAAQLAAA